MMTFSITEISLLAIGYLLILFAIAWSVEKGWVPSKIIHHPLTYVLSLGVFTSAWAYYGVIDLAFQFGYGSLAYYLGASALFLFAPLAISPIAQIANRFQINNFADLIVFRYHSHAAGSLTAACMVMIFLPLIVLQLQAVADTLQILTTTSSNDIPEMFSSLQLREVLALIYCALLAVFTIAFGANREYAPGIFVAMAFESLVKITALCAIGLLSIYGVFGGFDGLDLWLHEHPENLELLYRPIQSNGSHTLLLVFLASAVAAPHLFYISGTENFARHTSNSLSWAFPLFFLFLALPVFPILWAGFATNTPLPAQYFPLGVPMQTSSVGLTLLAFIGGLSAASSAMIALSLALGTMLLNQWLLPITRLGRRNLYKRLFWLRGIIILLIFSTGYVFYRALNSNFSLTDLALMAFIETLQFLPGLIAISNWSTANSRGYITGLTLGTCIWLIGAILPALTNIYTLHLPFLENPIELGISNWSDITLLSFGVNIAAFIAVSILTKSSTEESYSAELCTADELSHPRRMILDVHSADEFIERLSPSLGTISARKEVNRALLSLGLIADERRPYALRQLRDRLEGNLSGLLGTAVAGDILNKHIPFHLPAETGGTADINMIEDRLNQYRSHLTGLAAELNNLRLYHRNTLEELPMAACSLGHNHEILMWNQSMETLTGIPASLIVGSYMNSLQGPWFDMLLDFSDSPLLHITKQKIELEGSHHWINLHKANIHAPVADIADGQIILLEDMTEHQLLESELIHSERLASVGRLAAGVAHEIGNPITGIACLAQNLRYEADEPNAAIETADQILSQTERVTRIVQSLVSFSHSGSTGKIARQKISLRECAKEAIQLLSLQRDCPEVNYNNQIDANLTLTADPQKLIQVFINLLANARDASPEQSEILITATQQENQIIFHVADEGAGIKKNHQKRILEPFFTTKEPGKGTGLGLSMVYSIIKEHHGQIEFISPKPDGTNGTLISIKLPISLETIRNTGNTSQQ